MGKRYIMFVDERGFLSTKTSNSISMVGVVFEYEYCIELENQGCELRKRLNQYKQEVFKNSNTMLALDEVILQEDVYMSIDKVQRNKFVNGLPQLLKSLKFTILSSSIKKDITTENQLYSLVTKKLLKKFYSYIINENGESGGLIIEARGGNANYKIQQDFFDIYNESKMDLIQVENNQHKINSFIVCEKCNNTYGIGIEVLNIVNSIVSRVSNDLREIDQKLMLYTEYGNRDKIFNSINIKMYKDIQMYIPRRILKGVRYRNVKIVFNELKTLREQLRSEYIRGKEKEKEISELTDIIKLLNKQLEEALLSRKGDGIIFQILSDIDFKMKIIEKKALVAKN